MASPLPLPSPIKIHPYRNWPRNLLGWRRRAFSPGGMLAAAGSEHADLLRAASALSSSHGHGGVPPKPCHPGNPYERRNALAYAGLTNFATFASEKFFRETQNSAGQKATLTSSALGKRRVKKTVPNGPRKDFCGTSMGPPRGARKSKKGGGGG